jgi:hypothetical protein
VKGRTFLRYLLSLFGLDPAVAISFATVMSLILQVLAALQWVE